MLISMAVPAVYSIYSNFCLPRHFNSLLVLDSCQSLMLSPYLPTVSLAFQCRPAYQ
jgi:hypothetical protein